MLPNVKSGMLLIVASLLLAGCGNSTLTSEFCAVAKPIPNSEGNHPKSKVAIDAHNATGVDLCKW